MYILTRGMFVTPSQGKSRRPRPGKQDVCDLRLGCRQGPQGVPNGGPSSSCSSLLFYPPISITFALHLIGVRTDTSQGAGKAWGPRPGFLSPSTTDVWGGSLLGCVLCIVGCSAASHAHSRCSPSPPSIYRRYQYSGEKTHPWVRSTALDTDCRPSCSHPGLPTYPFHGIGLPAPRFPYL